MSRYIDQVFSLSHDILSKSDCGISSYCNTDGVWDIVQQMDGLKSSSGSWGYPSVLDNITTTNEHKIRLTILYELMASSINYCYWYGRGDIRPNVSGSSLVYKLLDEAFKLVPSSTYKENKNFQETGIICLLDAFRHNICLSRMPLLKERIQHIDQLIKAQNSNNGVSWIIDQCMKDWDNVSNKKQHPVDSIFYVLFTNLPGFAEDLFLKRSFLFLMQVNRRTGIFDAFIDDVPVPSDYQVPKMLEHFDSITYVPELKDMLLSNALIPKGSMYECGIRAATILTCEFIADKAKSNMDAVDNFLWLQRKECDKPFHLTITTDY